MDPYKISLEVKSKSGFNVELFWRLKIKLDSVQNHFNDQIHQKNKTPPIYKQTNGFACWPQACTNINVLLVET